MLASDAVVLLLARLVYAGVEPARRVPRFRHETHAPEPTGRVRSLTHKGLQTSFSPDVT